MLTVKESVRAEGGNRFTVTALIRGTVHHQVRDYTLVFATLPAGSVEDQKRVFRMLRRARYITQRAHTRAAVR